MTCWKPFLLALADEFDEPLLLTWETSNGATFEMLLPRREEFLENTFSAALGFGFQFDEIRRMHFEPDLHFGTLIAGARAFYRFTRSSKWSPPILESGALDWKQSRDSGGSMSPQASACG